MAGDHDGHVSNPFRPNQNYCCEACAFGVVKGRREHADWCPMGHGAASKYDMVDESDFPIQFYPEVARAV